MSEINTQKSNKTLDLKKVKQIIFNDINLLLDDLGLEYEEVADNIFMRCPIHEGSDNKQGVSISLTKQAWRCWTRGCHENLNTDIFGFIRGVMDDASFSEVLKYICKLYNVNDAKTKTRSIKKTADDGDGFASVVKIFNRNNKKSDIVDFIPVTTRGNSPYFESRGFSKQTLKHFGVEDCSDKFSSMRHRSIIPINSENKLIGYIARSTKGWLQPKYLFSEGLKKTDYLYNYDNAIEPAHKNSCMFLVEGQGDVWKLYEAGVYNAVGLFGKDISGIQRQLLTKSGATSLVVLTDNDQAGRESKIKIKRDMGRLFNLVFPKMYTKDLGNMSVEKIKDEILTNLRGCY